MKCFWLITRFVLMISEPLPKVTPGEVWILLKYRSIFPLQERLGGRISFVVQDSQYIYTASPWTPRICNLRNFCNIEVYPSFNHILLKLDLNSQFHYPVWRDSEIAHRALSISRHKGKQRFSPATHLGFSCG
jgi:hypothetical protein